MDAHHYDKIADKLMQFRSKLPHYPHLDNETARNYVREMKEQIDQMLFDIDQLANWDDKGWIR